MSWAFPKVIARLRILTSFVSLASNFLLWLDFSRSLPFLLLPICLIWVLVSQSVSLSLSCSLLVLLSRCSSFSWRTLLVPVSYIHLPSSLRVSLSSSHLFIFCLYLSSLSLSLFPPPTSPSGRSLTGSGSLNSAWSAALRRGALSILLPVRFVTVSIRGE